MKVGKISIQFNPRINGYASVEDVKYWRIYQYHVTSQTVVETHEFFGTRKVRRVRKTLMWKSDSNLTMDEVMLFASCMPKEPNTRWIAYPRKGRDNKLLMREEV